MKMRTTLLSLLPLAAVACSDGHPVDLGHTGAQLSDFAAHWDGYAEAYTFPTSNSDRVRLNLDTSGVGTIEVGEGAPLPAPSAEVGYPVDPYSAFRDGFQYPVQGARIEAGRIRFGVNSGDVYDAWCALQTPVPMTPQASSYGCLPNLGAMISNGGESCAQRDEAGVEIPVDCQKLMLCGFGSSVCTCTAMACTGTEWGDPSTLLGYDVLVDAALDADGQSLVGTMLYQSQRITVRLHKQGS
jgi:hypothetical protein